VSIAGGLDKAIDNGEAIGAHAIQTFASSPRTLQFRPVSQETVDLYLEKKAASNIAYHVFHGVYLINLAHVDPIMVKRGVTSLSEYQQLAGRIEGEGTVFHVGSHKGNGLAAVTRQVAQAIAEILKETPKDVWLMLENAAGHKGTIGQSFEELAILMDQVEKLGHDTHNLGICLDTQHAFASGFDLRQPEELERMIGEIETRFGLVKLRLLHVNDSLPEMGSKKDRHANLGEGHIGKESFCRLFSHDKLKHLPLLLEVPGKDKSGPRREDVAQLKEWCDEYAA